MLYDPKWHQPPPDIFALESLIAWLERQPGDREYTYTSSSRCLLCQYFRSVGLHVWSVGPFYYRMSCGGEMVPLSKEFTDVPEPPDNAMVDTFGAALTRARAALAARDV